MPKFFRRRSLLPISALRNPRKAWGAMPSARRFHTSRFRSNSDPTSAGTKSDGKRQPFRRRLAAAWNDTPTVWYPLPVGVGALLLALMTWRKKAEREAREDDGDAPVRAHGRWQVNVLGALPLRNMSRVWGYVNSFELPVWFRPTGFKLYAWFFGCNLEEIEPSDLTQYPSLGEFFYRRLKPGVRPIANAALVSPADGRITAFGKITNARVEQVKGMSYSLDALLGVPQSDIESLKVEFAARQGEDYDDEQFADVNGIEYTLNQLLGSQGQESGASTPTSENTPLLSGAGAGAMGGTPSEGREGPVVDASVPNESSGRDSVAVAAQMGASSVPPAPKRAGSISNVRPGNDLFFAVVYLAPGDYHRFHSPTAWVVEKRRHFSGELFSVSPWMTKRLQDLFVLNERVALLGRWRYGFFGMVPVGATNVGSIRINFDEGLRTNVRGRRRVSPGSFSEATYASASTLLRGQPLRHGQEMGGFRLGSTVVLVFEAPPTFQFNVELGQKVKVGERLGDSGTGSVLGSLPGSGTVTPTGEAESAVASTVTVNSPTP